MRDYKYTYNNGGEPSLDADAFYWLSEMGLKETQWILDTKWLSIDYNLAFQKWIDE